MSNRPTQAPPVSEGQEVDVRIESMGDKGDGVAKVQGFVIFVPGVAKGDWVKIQIEKVLQNVAFAKKLEEIDEPSDAEKKAQANQTRRGDEFADIDLDNLGEGSEDFGEEE